MEAIQESNEDGDHDVKEATQSLSSRLATGSPLAKARQGWREKQDQRRLMLNEMKQQAAGQQDRLEKLQHEKDRDRAHIAALERQYGQLQQKANAHRKRLEEEKKDSAAAHEAALMQQRQAHENEVARLMHLRAIGEHGHRERVAKMETEHGQLLGKLRDENIETVRRLAAQAQKFREEKGSLVAAQEADMKRLQQECEVLEKKNRDHIAKVDEETARIIATHEKATTERIKGLAEQFKAERASLIDNHNRDIKRLREEIDQRDVERKHQVDELQREKALAVTAHDNDLKRLQQESVAAAARQRKTDEDHARERQGLMNRIGELERHIEKSSAALAQHWKLPMRKRGKGSNPVNCTEPGELFFP